jgi:hypothetical protein
MSAGPLAEWLPCRTSATAASPQFGADDALYGEWFGAKGFSPNHMERLSPLVRTPGCCRTSVRVAGECARKVCAKRIE